MPTNAEKVVSLLPSLLPSIVAILLIAGALVAGCGGGDDGGADAGGGVDAQVGDGSTDAARDGSADGMVSSACVGVSCEGFEYCFEGACVPYPPCAGDGTCPSGATCHARYCVPNGVDIDGDGSPAGDDCDETDPRRSPLLPEICNGDDDDCDDAVDEGDPAAICEYYPGGGVCIDGSCGCPNGSFDLDRDVPGCECTADPPLSEGVTCATAIDLGDFPDSGRTLLVSGNVLPDDRVVWYRFRAVDMPDTSCDNFHVRARLAENPGDTFEMTVSRGDCAAVACPSPPVFTSDYSWATDFRGDVGGVLTGQCPCWAAPAAPNAAASHCTDDTANYFVRIRRRAGSALSCASYTLEITNGVYDTP